MPNLNAVIITGHLTRDPELRHLDSGSAVCNFAVALNERWRDKNTGEDREEVTYLDCEAWGKQGEFVNEYFRKGSCITVQGRLRQDRWETDDGQKRSRIKIRCDRVSFGDSKGADRDQPEPRQGAGGDDAGPGADGGGGDDDNLPF